MKYFTVIFFLSYFFVSTFAKIEIEDAVLVLTNENIEEAIRQNDYMLVEFYAPWCGHCKALAPEYAKAAKKLEEIGSLIKLAKVDATVEKGLAEKHQVQGYPTLKFYRKGSFIPYTGGRKADEIFSWVIQKSETVVKDLQTVEEAKSFIDTQNVVIVGFFKNVESDGAKVFLQVANADDYYIFGITSNDEVLNEYGVEDGKIILFKKFDEGKNEFDGELNVEKLQQFISIHALPLVVDFNPDTAPKIFSDTIKSHLLIFLNKEAGHYDQYVEKFKEPAKKFRGNVLFVTINTHEADHERILEFFGVKENEIPGMRIIKMKEGYSKMSKYKPEEPELSSENILEFVTAFVEGKLKVHLLAQDLPEDWDKNPVKVLVASNFHEVAYDKKKDVLVEFYAPWCGHCTKLAPIYDALGEKYKNNEDIVIAKMDGTENELEDVRISGYPTIILYKKDTNEAVTYGGERTLEGLSRFLKSRGAYGQTAEEAQEEDEDDDVPRKDEL